MPVRRLVIATSLIAAGLAAAAAQTAPAGNDAVDTSALRYYAARHETARMEAEIRRLRSLHPGWQAPADPAALTDPGGTSDDQPLWDLFGADKLDQLEAEIARHKAADPQWSAPPELVTKLALKQARKALIAASDRKDYAAVVNLATTTPAVVDTADLDVAWRVAEAQARSGDTAKSLAIDRAILTGNQDPAVRLATVRMAVAALPQADLPGLMALGRTGPDGRSEFEPVTLDLVRQRVGRVLAGDAPDDVAQDDLDRLTASAHAPSGAADAALLGWLSSKRKAWTKADEWFQIALSVVPAPAKAKPDEAKIAQGRILALQSLGRRADAETLAYQWRDADPAVTLLYIGLVEPDLTRPKPIAIDEDRLKRFSDVVVAQQSGDGAQALGWYAYNVGQFRPASAWFEHAMAWQPRNTTALGLALALQRLGDRARLQAFLAENKATFPALSALGSVPRDDGAPARRRPQGRRHAALDGAPPAGRAGETDDPAPGGARRNSAGCAGLSMRQSPAGRGADALQKGWCLMARQRPQEAAMAFSAARGDAGTSVDAAYGEALAELRNQRSAAAVEAASLAPLSSARRNEIGLAALAQTATTSFDQGRYETTLQALDRRRAFAAEPRDLMILRAWSLYHTDHREEAQRLFGMLDQQLSTPDTRSGLGATSGSGRY